MHHNAIPSGRRVSTNAPSKMAGKEDSNSAGGTGFGTRRVPPSGSTSLFAKGTPRRPPTGSTAGGTLVRLPLKGGVIRSWEALRSGTRLSLNPRHCRRTGFSNDDLRASAPHSPKRRSRNSSITPPLRGSRSRMAKASAEGGSHKQRRMARSCAPSRVRTGQVTGEGRSGGGPTPAPRTAAPNGAVLCAVPPPMKSATTLGPLNLIGRQVS